jgi:hypothetical protein
MRLHAQFLACALTRTVCATQSALAATCPVTATLDFKGAVKPCAKVEDACTLCSNALALPFIAAGVPAADTATLLACGAAQSTAMLAAGVRSDTLAAISSCPPPAKPTKSCPVKATASDFRGAVAECSTPATACGAGCVSAVRKPFIDKGVSASNLNGLASCIVTYAGNILAAGVPKETLTEWDKCSARPKTPQQQQSLCVTNCVTVGTYCDNAKDSTCTGQVTVTG